MAWQLASPAFTQLGSYSSTGPLNKVHGAISADIGTHGPAPPKLPMQAHAAALGFLAAALPAIGVGRNRRQRRIKRHNAVVACAAPSAAVSQYSWQHFGEDWEVHKFGGASLETAQLYQTCGDLLLSQAANGPNVRVPTAAIVSAAGGMTDALVSVVNASVDDLDKANSLLQAAADRQKSILLEAVPGKPEITDPVIKNIDQDQVGVMAMLKASSMMRGVPPQMLELVAGLGEVWSAQTLAAYLSYTGVKAEWVDARDVLIVEDVGLGGLGEKGQAMDTIEPEWDQTMSKLQTWWDKKMGVSVGNDLAPFLIFTGFVCSTPAGRPTTLKRSGSDYSATIFAKVLGASKVSFWKNVSGVYTADPRQVPAAFPIPKMTFDEAMELSYFGGQVLHPSAMVPCIEKRIPVYVKNVFHPSHPGTRVYGRGDAQFRWDDQLDKDWDPQMPVTAVTSIEKVTLVTVAGASFLGTPGVAKRLMEALMNAGVNVILASQGSSEHSITVAVDANDGKKALEAASQAFELELARNEETRCFSVEDCSILAVIGEGMKNNDGISGRFFDSLGRAKVNVVAIAQGSSERNISVVIQRDDLSRALRAVHGGLALSELQVAVAVIGTGQVGTEILKQLHNFQAAVPQDFAAPAMRAASNVSFDIRAVCDLNRMVTAEEGVPLQGVEKCEKDLASLTDWGQIFAQASHDHGCVMQDTDFDKMIDFFDNPNYPHKVIIDATNSDSVPDLYPQWLKRGIHVISPNKRAGSGSEERFKECLHQLKHWGQWHYESSAGSQLPIISTIRDLYQTGDRVKMVSGPLSGTLNFVLSSIEHNPSMKFSEAVRVAVESQLTESNCAEDLSGNNAARKALIIARELGLELELEDVSVQSLLPSSISTESKPLDTLVSELQEHVDADMEKVFSSARANQEKLAYVAEIDVEAGKVSLGLRTYKDDSLPYKFRANETAISFVTERYPASTPLIFKGPCAGPFVTASSAFADLLRLCRTLRV